MDLTPEQRAALAATASLATTFATAANPVVGQAMAAVSAIVTAIMDKGANFSMDDFKLAVLADDAAAADELAAQAEARA